jgi:hypothetical protein
MDRRSEMVKMFSFEFRIAGAGKSEKKRLWDSAEIKKGHMICPFFI